MTFLLAFQLSQAAPAAPERTETRYEQRERPPVRALPPPRGQLQVAVGVLGGASDWTSDPLGYGAFAIGLRLYRVLTFHAGLALGYARLDQRLLTRLTLGIDLGWTFANRFRPHVYAAFVHQHEESLAALAQQPFGAVLGIGTAIRHRAGAHVGLGFDVNVVRRPNAEFAVGPDLSFMYLTYSSGPTWYWLAGVTATLAVRLF